MPHGAAHKCPRAALHPSSRFRTIDTAWQVTGYSVSGAMVDPLVGTTLTTRFDAEEASGSAGCNDYAFFVYYAPGPTHAPHHVPKAWADKYIGRMIDALKELEITDERHAKWHI